MFIIVLVVRILFWVTISQKYLEIHFTASHRMIDFPTDYSCQFRISRYLTYQVYITQVILKGLDVKLVRRIVIHIRSSSIGWFDYLRAARISQIRSCDLLFSLLERKGITKGHCAALGNRHFGCSANLEIILI